METTTNKQRWLYSIANLGNVIPYQASNFILFFFTDVKRLPVQWASTAMLVFAFGFLGFFVSKLKVHQAFKLGEE